MLMLSKLADASRARDSIVCIGLDPEPERIPEHLGNGAQAAVRFLRRIIRATSDHACAYKPNLAFYEQYGQAGVDVLALVLQEIPKDIPVILDAKRGDVPNTSAPYARALYERWGTDAATVSPYVGLDSIAPFCELGYAFVLARTSNPGARDFQDLDVGGSPLYEVVVRKCVERFPAERCGFVVGATYPEEARRLRRIAPDRLFLLPGLGAQGGDAADAIGAALDAKGGGVLPSASRSVIYASDGRDFETAAANAARELKETVNGARSAAVLVTTGTLQALNRLVLLEDLYETPYGIALLAKILLLIALVALLVLGPERMPRLMRDVGKTVNDLRKTSDQLRGDLLNADLTSAERMLETASRVTAQVESKAADAGGTMSSATQADIVAEPAEGTAFDKEARLARERIAGSTPPQD